MHDSCCIVIDSIIEQRKARGLTQRELAEAAHIPQSALARIESRSNTPKLDTLMKVIDALGCTIEVVPK